MQISGDGTGSPAISAVRIDPSKLAYMGSIYSHISLPIREAVGR